MCASQAWPQGQPYTYTTLAAPDAEETHADGLNEYAEVVGVFTTHLGDVPYLLQGSAYNPITPNKPRHDLRYTRVHLRRLYPPVNEDLPERRSEYRRYPARAMASPMPSKYGQDLLDLGGE